MSNILKVANRFLVFLRLPDLDFKGFVECNLLQRCSCPVNMCKQWKTSILPAWNKASQKQQGVFSQKHFLVRNTALHTWICQPPNNSGWRNKLFQGVRNRQKKEHIFFREAEPETMKMKTEGLSVRDWGRRYFFSGWRGQAPRILPWMQASRSTTHFRGPHSWLRRLVNICTTPSHRNWWKTK